MLALVMCSGIFSAKAHDKSSEPCNDDEIQEIASRIWFNEGAGKPEYLLWWNEGESFASLGIGHFIWYPPGTDMPFVESFPDFLGYVQKQGKTLPRWLARAAVTGCPWHSRQSFMRAKETDSRMADLRRLLTRTVSIQASFIMSRLEPARVRMISAAHYRQRPAVEYHFNRLSSVCAGMYALVDYLNFKGDGTVASERYDGYGWGLLQVLLALKPPPADSQDAWLNAFADAADQVLERRVRNAPPKRNEFRWLAGWQHRVSGYRTGQRR